LKDLAHFVDALLIAVHPLPYQDYGIDVECEYLLGGADGASQRTWYLAMPSRWPRGASPEAVESQVDCSDRATREPGLEADLWKLASAVDRHARSGGRFLDPRRHYLTPGAEVPFRIEHIIDIRRWEERDIDDFLANTLHRRWS
jgi:hypothetical protein